MLAAGLSAGEPWVLVLRHFAFYASAFAVVFAVMWVVVALGERFLRSGGTR